MVGLMIYTQLVYRSDLREPATRRRIVADDGKLAERAWLPSQTTQKGWYFGAFMPIPFILFIGRRRST